MSDKSFVSMEQQQCIVCGAIYDTGSLLLDKRLKPSLEPKTVTGTGLCPAHQKLKDEGYIALIELERENGPRTGTYVHIKAEVWPDIFKEPPPPKGVAFVDPQVVKLLAKIQHPDDKPKGEPE